jgi:hypothetical protein
MNEINDRQLHKKFAKLGLQKLALTRKLYVLIPEIEKRKIYLKKGCSNIQDYALKYAGLSYSAVRNCLNVIEKASSFPLIEAEIPNVGLYKVQLALRIANRENEQIVVDKMKNMSRSALKLLVSEAKEYGLSGTDRQCKAVPLKMTISLSLEAIKKFNILKYKLKIDNEEKLLLAILELAEKQLSSSVKSKEILEEKLQKNNISSDAKFLPARILRYIPSSKKTEVLQRSKGLCEYPGCLSNIKIFHHIDRFSEKRNHKNIIGLCKEHHEFAHNNLMNEETFKFRFEKGVRYFADFQRREIIGINSG